MKIVIDGNIGAGKSTLLNELYKKHKYIICKEDIEVWKPWLSLFYKNTKKNSFGFQLRVLLSHLKHKDCDSNYPREPVFLERSPSTCNNIFGVLLKESGDLTNLEYNLCEEYEKEFGWNPDIYIYLHTTPEICHKRIKKRNRLGEETISIEYLKKVHNQYENVYKNLLQNSFLNKTEIYKIDASKSTTYIIEEILNILNPIKLNTHF